MSTNFQWINVVPSRTKKTVNGYIKKNQECFFANSATFYTIPELVTYIVLDYYYERESFRNIYTDRIIKLNPKSQIASIQKTRDAFADHTVYGSLSIDFNHSYLYVWKLNILKLPTNTFGAMITLGIAKQNSLNEICYEYSNYGAVSDENKCPIFAQPFYARDTVRLQINTKQCTLQYFVNDNEISDCMHMNTVVLESDHRFCFCVKMKQNCSVQLTEFSQVCIQK